MYQALLFSVPALLLVFFAVCLCRYTAAVRANKTAPDSFSAEEIKHRKILLIIASSVVGTIAIVLLGVIILLTLAVAFM